MEKIKIRGLVTISGWIFLCWGVVVSLKGFYDVFLGEPEANLFSPQKWDFVSKKQWLTWSGFEIAYGLACIGVCYLLGMYAKFLPEYIERKNEQNKTV